MGFYALQSVGYLLLLRSIRTGRQGRGVQYPGFVSKRDTRDRHDGMPYSARIITLLTSQMFTKSNIPIFRV